MTLQNFILFKFAFSAQIIRFWFLCVQLLNLWRYVTDRSLVNKVPDSGAVTAVLPADGRERQLLNQLSQIPHVTVYRKEDIPDRFHYKNNPRIMPIIILADEGWILTDVSQI